MPPPLATANSGSVGSTPSSTPDEATSQITQQGYPTPQWAKTTNTGPTRVGNEVKINAFRYENAIDSLATPDNVRAMRVASGETPDLAVAILAALEHAKNPNFYAPYESPIEYGFQKKNKPGSNATSNIQMQQTHGHHYQQNHG